MNGTKILPNEHSLDELLDALDNADIKDNSQELAAVLTDRNDDVPRFLITFSIKKGNDKIKKKLLYNLYSQWSKEPVSNTCFSIRASKYLDCDSNWFFINDNDILLTNKVKSSLKPKRNPAHIKNYRKHFEYFLNKFNIKKADKKSQNSFWVKWIVIFFLYQNWCGDNNEHPKFTDRYFLNMLKIYLGEPKKLDRDTTVFNLDSICRDIFTDDLINKASIWIAARYTNTNKLNGKSNARKKKEKKKV